MQWCLWHCLFVEERKGEALADRHGERRYDGKMLFPSCPNDMEYFLTKVGTYNNNYKTMLVKLSMSSVLNTYLSGAGNPLGCAEDDV